MIKKIYDLFLVNYILIIISKKNFSFSPELDLIKYKIYVIKL